MDNISRITSKIDQIERLLGDIRDQLGDMSKDSEPRAKTVRKTEPLATEEEFQAEYERLCKEFAEGNAGAVESFVKSKTKVYLKAFCKANNLPLDAARLRKDEIANEVMQWMAQRKAITKNVY